MAIYHYSAQIIGRSQGRSAVAAAAYRAGEKLLENETGEIKDYSKKKVYNQYILAPDNAPEWAKNREQLWNEVQKVEKRKDAQLCREINVALPVELDKGHQQMLIHNFVRTQYVKKGMVADICFHEMEGKNPHAHIMLTTREIGPDGFGKKERSWNDRELLKSHREAWAQSVNTVLSLAKKKERVDHRSLEKQGIEREPEIHLGPKPHPERIARNNAIKARNTELPELKKELHKIINQLKDIEQESKKEEETKQLQRERKKYLSSSEIRRDLDIVDRKQKTNQALIWDIERNVEYFNKEYKENSWFKKNFNIFFITKKEKEWKELNNKYIKLQEEKKELAEEKQYLEKENKILWEKERPEREKKEKERAAEFQRKSQERKRRIQEQRKRSRGRDDEGR